MLWFRTLLVAGISLAFVSAAGAHVLKLYAEVVDGVIQGEAYFSTGTVPVDTPVAVFLPGRHKTGEVRTDAQGKFRYTPVVRQNHTFVIDAGEGHHAEWTIERDELPATLPAR